MPIYIYHCGDCNHEFEQYQKFSDEALRKCPVCGKDALHKVFQPVGIVFKGKGFYSTDNRSTNGLGTAKVKEESTTAPAEAPKSGSAKAEKSSELSRPIKEAAMKAAVAEKAS